jgi:DNA polymerase I-like protein with 3'-5' exonuclease and polymerase domains/uracil-DNA glycosylase
MAIVGEGPGRNEVEEGRPFVGESGDFLFKQIRHVGLHRNRIHVNNAFLCRPADNKLDVVLKQLKAENDKRREENRPLSEFELSPIDACRPRLLEELKPFENVVLAGKIAYQGLTGHSASILAVRGGMIEWEGPGGDKKKVLPTVHPAFVLRAMRWTKVLRSDFSRAYRWFSGLHEWRPPTIVHRPSAKKLREFLFSQPILAYDVETDGLEPMTARLRCLGIGNGEIVYMIPVLPKDKGETFSGYASWFHGEPYSESEWSDIVEVLRAWFVFKDCIKVGHNSGVYDTQVIQHHFGVVPTPALDTLGLHKLVESELPHDLGFTTSIYGELSPAWKADRTATTAEDDRELHDYCGTDVKNTFDVAKPLIELVQLRKQEAVYKLDAGMQEVCVGMHQTGLLIDRKRRNEWVSLMLNGGYDPRDVDKYQKSVAKWVSSGSRGDGPPKPRYWRGAVGGDRPLLKEMQDTAERHFGKKWANLNPASVKQLRALLFDKAKLPLVNGSNGKPKLTKTGDFSTDDETIRALLISPIVSKDWKAFLTVLRNYRAQMKLYGTYLAKLIPMSDDQMDDMGLEFDADDPEVEVGEEFDSYEEMELASLRRKKEKDRKGIIWPDGRIRPTYSVHGTQVGRIACKRPNCLNVPGYLRDLFIAGPGHVYVGADMDQIHLRIAASHWNLTRYLEVFANGGDPHALTAELIYGDEFLRAPGHPSAENGFKWTGKAKGFRQIAKVVSYASLYKAKAETVWRVLTETENDFGELIYADLSREKARQFHAAWVGGLPELNAAWDRALAFFRQNGYTADPVIGRRRDFLDSTDTQLNENEIINHEILAAEQAIVGPATIKFNQMYPPGFGGPGTGITLQNYDSINAEVPEKDGERIRQELQETMTVEVPQLKGVRFTAEAKIGPDVRST